MNRRITFVSAIIIVAFISCDQQEIKNLKYRNHSLKTSNLELNAEIESYLHAFNAIEDNLAEIKRRENMIDLKKSGGDLMFEEDLKESIILDIQMINGLMAENLSKINDLSNRLSESNSEFKQMVNRLKNRIQEKDIVIASLKTELENENIENSRLSERVTLLAVSVDTLTAKSERQDLVIQTSSDIIREKDELLNAGFVTIGSHKDLKVKEVIEDEGGILGIGSTQQLKSNFNQNAFSRIDIRTTNVIPIDAKKLKFVTNHPKESYELFFNEERGNVEAIQILNECRRVLEFVKVSGCNDKLVPAVIRPGIGRGPNLVFFLSSKTSKNEYSSSSPQS